MKAGRALAWAVLIVAGCSDAPAAQPDRRPSMPVQVQGPFQVTAIVDGDTLTVDTEGTATTVRLLGIDTPETVDPDRPPQCFGPEAAARADELLTGQHVWLQSDPSQGQVDTYGRALAYVWLANNRLVNLQLIEEGYAREYTYDDTYLYRGAFLVAEAEAFNARRGLWSSTTCAGR